MQQHRQSPRQQSSSKQHVHCDGKAVTQAYALNPCTSSIPVASSPHAAEVTESMIPQTARPAMTPSFWPPQAAKAKMHSLPYSDDWSQSVKPAPYAFATCICSQSCIRLCITHMTSWQSTH